MDSDDIEYIEGQHWMAMTMDSDDIEYIEGQGEQDAIGLAGSQLDARLTIENIFLNILYLIYINF